MKATMCMCSATLFNTVGRGGVKRMVLCSECSPRCVPDLAKLTEHDLKMPLHNNLCSYSKFSCLLMYDWSAIVKPLSWAICHSISIHSLEGPIPVCLTQNGKTCLNELFLEYTSSGPHNSSSKLGWYSCNWCIWILLCLFWFVIQKQQLNSMRCLSCHGF